MSPVRRADKLQKAGSLKNKVLRFANLDAVASLTQRDFKIPE
jgi:hypothetical protein